MMLIGTVIGMLATQPVCDPRGGPKHEWTKAQRMETRRRVRNVAKLLGVAPHVRAYLDLIVVRESSGSPSVRHSRGRREDGLGSMGLSLRWHRDKWPARDEDPMFCLPEVSAVVAIAILWRAVKRFNAATVLELQAIYSGSWTCTRWQGRRKCWAEPTARTIRLTCPGMAHRGFSCGDAVSPDDLGRYVPLRERRAFALEARQGFRP